MKSVLERIGIHTSHDTELINITSRVIDLVGSAGVDAGIVYVTTMHTTTGITVNEGLPDVEADIVSLIQRLAPTDGPYRHARWLPSDGTMAVNSSSHQRSALLGMQVAFPIDGGRVVLGGRQNIYFAELDGPTYREFVVHILGESAQE